MGTQTAFPPASEADARGDQAGLFLAPVRFEDWVDEWRRAKPFSHIVLDDFLRPDVLADIIAEFPDERDPAWYRYDNKIEAKGALNNWDRFGPQTYRLMTFLNSREFIRSLEVLTRCSLYPDFGLNGAGLHSYGRGGKLNVHKDYSIHPRLGLERRLNLLVYLTPDWHRDWGGDLGLWENDPVRKAPGALAKSIAPLCNRAVLFDTTQDSWHGLPEPIDCPEKITRNSIALYYLCVPSERAEARGRALFVPYKDQVSDPEVLELVQKRASVTESSSVYRKK